jgi:hypothetical protein
MAAISNQLFFDNFSAPATLPPRSVRARNKKTFLPSALSRPEGTG